MRNLISFVHISLDGFVAGPNGEMNWITINQEIFDHVEQRIKQTDTALYGRVTYDLMEGYWPTAADKPDATDHDRAHSKWYAQSHKLVLSNTLAQEGRDKTTIINGDISGKLNAIKSQPGSEILLFGSPRATHVLTELGLIDGYWLFVNPIILGKGLPLFTGSETKTALALSGTHTFTCGVTELRYIKS